MIYLIVYHDSKLSAVNHFQNYPLELIKSFFIYFVMTQDINMDRSWINSIESEVQQFIEFATRNV